MTDLTIPNDWTPRPYQLPVLRYLQRTPRARAVCVWHRRAGKDSFSLNYAAIAAHQQVGVYWHMLPAATQARKVIWDGIDKAGRRMIDQAFPPQLRKSTNNHEMKIEFLNGSIWQAVGSDNYDSLIGTNPRGVIFSEYAVANPRAWDYLRPILAENEGWAIFISTPRGANHFHKLHKVAQSNDNWFSELLTATDTNAFPPEVIEEERATGMPEDMIQQEYFCSFDGGMEGAFFTREMTDLFNNRHYPIPHDPASPVMTVWDIGVRDATAILILQRHPQTGNPVLIDYYEDRNKGLAHYISWLRNQRYIYHCHYAPHDIEQREFTTASTRRETASRLGIEFDVTPNLPLAEGLQATRDFLNILHVNSSPDVAEQINRWRECLSAYKRVYDPVRAVYSDKPEHGWASHAADATRYAGLVWEPGLLDSEYSWAGGSRHPLLDKYKVIHA